LSAERKGFNEYKIIGDLVIIYITNRKNEHFEVYIDKYNLQKFIDLDYPVCAKYHTRIKGYYAVCTHYIGKVNGKYRTKSYYMHRLITNARPKEIVDHENHVSLDNREQNLVVTTNSKNSQNRNVDNNNSNTGVLNVSWIEKSNRYWVQMMKDGKHYRWSFLPNQFDEACNFAKIKRQELFG
jgi:hypothetical protein